MNILTFDIEEWFIEKAFDGARKEKYGEFDLYLEKIFHLLEETSTKATFFCVGKMATDFPNIIKKIAEQGHEIGCHSNVHTWLNKMTYEDALQDTREAVDSLEQCVGKKVLSYRAPAFSIGENNKWAFDILAECAIKRDASIFPAVREFGGFPSFGYKEPVLISHNGVNIKEFPICTTKLMGKELAYSGGGYFRFFPLWFIEKEIKKSTYSMCYFHISDLMTINSKPLSRQEYEEYYKDCGTIINRYKRHFKNNFGKKGAFEKLERLLKTEDFENLEHACSIIDWAKCPKKVL